MRVNYEKLWRLMEENLMKKNDLARAAKISKATITNMNQGKFVSMEIMSRFCKIFHCDIGDVMTVIEE